ncbi:MAG: hypothetical protein KatS3mg061_2282 [Dehalococcoidia bacterium]|nr:MAG: hypothetical protein KatS3mg061_2282 [Dehalococcoidia bacterium]
MAQFGIEHEVAFLRPDGSFADWTTTRFEEFAAIVQHLPRYESDYPMLRIGDLGIKEKRWYIEGYERYDNSGQYLTTAPKGIEVRTTIQPSIAAAVAELSTSFAQLRQHALAAGFEPVWISLNPFQTRFQPEPPLCPWEQARRASSPEKQTAEIPMLTYGPDLNLSFPEFTPERCLDAGRKLTYYSPWIVPFSFSSPFSEGQRWPGYSRRTFLRTGARPAALVFLADRAHLVPSQPSLTKPARIPAEDGRIEFKACDSCADFRLYGALLALVKGVVLSDRLSGRALTPDRTLHQHVARVGFDDPTVCQQAAQVLAAAAEALADDPDRAWLQPLHDLLARRQTPAHALIAAYEQSGSIAAALRGSYLRGGEFAAAVGDRPARW